MTRQEHDGVTVVTVTRPVLAIATLQALDAAFAELARLQTPVVLASSHPRIFLAGADLAEIAALDRLTSGAYAQRGRALMQRVRSHPAAVVAAVNGVCAGGGVDLVMACDAVVATTEARLHHPGARRGLVTGWSGTTTIPTRIGLQRCAPLVTGEPFDSTLIPGCTLTSRAQLMVAAVAEVRRLQSLHPTRLSLWRSFRCGNFVDSFRARVVHT